MIFFSVGLPSRFGEWCDALTARLIRHRLDPVEICGVSTLEDLAVAAIRTPVPHLVAVCRQPGVRLQTAIAEGGRPFLIALGDPRAAIREMIARGSDFVGATRAVASGCAAMFGLMSSPQALVLSCDGASPIVMATAVARHLGFDLDAGRIEEAVNEVGDIGTAPDPGEVEAWRQGLNERQQAVIDGALRPYIAYFAARSSLDRLVWERELFYLYDDPPAAAEVPATRPVDLTGRARVLLYGPGVVLPPGNWSAAVVLGFSAETTGRSFIIDVFAGRQLAASRIESPGAQIVETFLHFTVDQTLDQRIEVRVQSERAAFEGRVALGHVALTPHGVTRPDLEEYLLQMLNIQSGAAPSGG